jgi:hypothetical protein
LTENIENVKLDRSSRLYFWNVSSVFYQPAEFNRTQLSSHEPPEAPRIADEYSDRQNPAIALSEDSQSNDRHDHLFKIATRHFALIGDDLFRMNTGSRNGEWNEIEEFWHIPNLFQAINCE